MAHSPRDPTGTAYKPRHIDSLEGLRAVASVGIIVTHVGFQTGVDPASHLGAVVSRFDFFVAVFYALSAFLLWRSYGPGTGRLATARGVGKYYRSRIGRIMPAYLVLVVSVIVLLPEATTMTAPQIIANLTLTQIYIPDGLVSGLTHLWSLAVEVAFYAVLPLIALVLARGSKRVRVAVICVVAVISLGWAYLPFVEASPADGVANRQIWPPAYTLWFSVGLLAAEAEGHVGPRLRRVLSVRWPLWICALLIAWIAGREWYGPLGLTHPEPDEFARRIIAGALFAALFVVPPALAPREEFLSGAVMTTLGRWSYSIFLWHVALMAVIFPLSGISYFSGGFVPILVLTVLVTVVVSALSYQFVEVPGQQIVRRIGGRVVSRGEAGRVGS